MCSDAKSSPGQSCEIHGITFTARPLPAVHTAMTSSPSHAAYAWSTTEVVLSSQSAVQSLKKKRADAEVTRKHSSAGSGFATHHNHITVHLLISTFLMK